MKNFYKVSNTIENGPRMDRKRTVVGPMKDRQKSRISPINHRLWTVIAPMLLVAFGLFGVNENAWGAKRFYAQCRVESKPTEGGKVYVGRDKKKDDSYSFVTETADQTGTNKSGYLSNSTTSTTIDGFYGYQVANSGYQFSGWSTNPNATSGTDDPQDNKYNLTWSGYQNNCKYYDLPVTATSTSESSPTVGTYYAIFTPKQYKITLNKQSGSGGADEIAVTYNSNTNLTSEVSTPSRSGYVFRGYYTEVNGGGIQLIDANGNVIARAGDSDTYTDKDKKWKNAGGVTLYACWKAEYTITFNAHGGSAVSSKKVVSGEQYGTLSTTTRSSYTFAGWYTAETGGTQVTSETTVSITANQTLHAHWLAHYSVAFKANGGNGSMDAQGFVQGTAQNLNANTFTRTGYTFAGWATSASGSVEYADKANVNNLSSTGNAIVDLYAKWTANTYYVSFSGNGNTGGSMSNQTFSYDEAKSLLSNTYVKSYTVTFNGNSGTPASSELTASAPFLGWATSENGDKAYDDKQSVSNLTSSNGATVPLYAKWGTGSITLPTATRSAYHLDGWYIGDTKVGDAGQAYTPTSNVELTAHWTQSQLATSFNGSDQSMNVDDVQNSAFTLSNAPSAQVHIEVTSIDDVTDGSGKVIEYNAATNTITARNAGVATIYFTQEETEYVTGGTSATWTYTVTKKDPSFTGSAYNGLKVDDVQEADYSYSNVSASEPSASSSDNFYYTIDDVAFAKSAKNKGNNLVTYNPSTKEITACNAGTGKITLHQKETYKYNAGSKSFNVTVSKYDPSFDGSAYNELKVEEVQTVDYSSSNTSSAKPSASSSDAFYYTIDVTSFANESLNKGTDLATYDAASNTLTPKNAGTGSVTFHQSETYKYNPGSQSFGITIAKWDNAIYVKGNTSYNGSTSLAGVISGVTLTATNTDYTNSPFEVEQTEGDNVALYDKSAQTITAIGTAGTATWTVHQDENYKYLEADNTFSVDVALNTEMSCAYVLETQTGEENNNLGSYIHEHTWTANNVAGVVRFEAKKVSDWSTDPYVRVEERVNGTWQNVTNGKIDDLTTTYAWKQVTLSRMATGVRFMCSGSLDNYVRNVSVSRKTWFNAADVTIDKTSTNNPVYPSDGTGVGTLTIHYSLAGGGDLHIYNDNPKFTLSQTTISDAACQTDERSTDIGIQYESSTAGTDYAHLVIYNDNYRKEVTITGITSLRTQVVNWEVGDVVRLGSETENAAWVITGNTVNFSSSATDIIDVVDGKLVAKGIGSAVITATADAKGDYAAAYETKTIEVTNDEIQWIDWNQTFLRLKLGGSNVTLTASAKSDVEGCTTEGARPITYSSADESVVRIVNTNQLQIVGAGTTVITATQAGGLDTDGHKYMAVSKEKTVIVRDPNAPCVNYLYVQPDENEWYCGWNHFNRQYKEFVIDNLVDPSDISLQYKGEYKRVALTDYFYGTMQVEEWYEGEWHDISGTLSPQIGNYQTFSHALNRNTTKVRISTHSGVGYHYFKDCKIGQSRYIETNTLSAYEAKVGQTVPQTLSISYDNIVGDISLTLGHAQSNFSLSQNVITGDCGDRATVNVTVSYTPTAATESEVEVLTITDGTTTTYVNLSGSATVTDREIIWDQESPASKYTVESVTLTASALTTVGHHPAGEVFYTLGGLSTTGAIDGTTLTFDKAGVAYVSAQGKTSVLYNTPAAVTKQFNVALTPTEVVTAPTIGSVVSGTALSDITVSGGTARNTINQGSVSGTFTVQNGNVTDVGQHTATLLFTPEDGTMYTTCTYNMSIEVTQRPATDEEIGTVTAGHITFGEKLSDAVLSMNGTLNGHGTLVMTDPQKDEVKDVDTYENLKVLFTPGNTNIAPKELTVSVTVDKANPAVTPQATDITYGQPISASNITTASGDVAGSWAWAVDDTQVLSVGDHVLKANFTSDSANYNNLSNVDVTLTVNKIETLEVEVPLSFCAGGSETFHGNTYSEAGEYQIEAEGATRDTVYNVTVTVLQPTTGTDSKTITVGDNESWHGNDLSGYAVGSYEVEYHTTNVAGCDSTVTLSLTVNKIETLNVPVALSFCAGESETFHGETYTTAGTDQINAVGATRDTVYNVTVTVLQPTTGTDSKTITVGDNESWHGNDLSGYAVGSYEVEYHTTNVAGCDSTVTLSLTVNAVVPVGPNTFTGNGEWENPSNWSTGIVPTTAEPDIIVVGQLVINEEKTIGGLTIMPTGGVTIVDDGKLTVNGTTADQSGYGDLYVANGGEVEVAGSLTVRDLIVEASIGTSEGNAESGQVASAENIVYTNAYIDINMDPSGFMDDTKWYGFTVPFAVDGHNGVSRLEGTAFRQCVYGTDYLIAEYDANKRLNSGNGWKFISGSTLNAGQFYFLTVDGSYNTYRFKASGNSYTPAAAASLYVNGSTTNYDANWNGVGNSTLQHVTASYTDGEYVQVYMNGQDAYKTVNTNDATFVVGCPFFVQAKVVTTLALNVQTATTQKYYAPRRAQEESTDVVRINLSATDGGYSDQIYFSAVDKEQDAYIIGQDLAKAGVSTVVPQLWMAQYNQKLSVHEATWNGDRATCPLGIYVPKNGEYVLTATQPEDGTQIYLTENGAPIWDLTMSEYVLSLEKGNTSSYGLMIVRAPQVTTGVEDIQGTGAEVRKVIIDNTMYIITPEGTMFNVIGKKVQ